MPGLIVLLSRSYGGGFLTFGLFAQRSRAWLVPPPSGGIDSRHPLAARALRSGLGTAQQAQHFRAQRIAAEDQPLARRSEEHTSELQSLMRISYAVFCLKKKKHNNTHQND